MSEDKEQLLRNARDRLSSLGSLHKFKLSKPLPDLWNDGKKTKVLKVNLDYEGYLVDYLSWGNPLSYDDEGDIETNRKVLSFYTDKMTNVDLTSENLEIIGQDTIEQLRGVIEGFFILRLAISILSQPSQERKS